VDLLVTYLPYPDEVLHTAGYLDPSPFGHDPRQAACALDEVLKVADGLHRRA
jgi:hypothetical protein